MPAWTLTGQWVKCCMSFLARFLQDSAWKRWVWDWEWSGSWSAQSLVLNPWTPTSGSTSRDTLVQNLTHAWNPSCLSRVDWKMKVCKECQSLQWKMWVQTSAVKQLTVNCIVCWELPDPCHHCFVCNLFLIVSFIFLFLTKDVPEIFLCATT